MALMIFCGHKQDKVKFWAAKSFPKNKDENIYSKINKIIQMWLSSLEHAEEFKWEAERTFCRINFKSILEMSSLFDVDFPSS